MDVERENVGSLLRRVIRAAHPDVLQELVSGLSLSDVKSTGEACTLFVLFGSMYQNVRTPAALVHQCLQYAWQLAISPEQRRFVVPCGQPAGRSADGGKVGSSPGGDGTREHLLGISIFKAEALWRQAHGALSLEDSFAALYIRKCLQLIEKTEALPVALSTLQFLLRSLADPVRLADRMLLAFTSMLAA
jgi:hypothetical protein